MKIDFITVCDKGLVREENEDTVSNGYNDKINGYIFVLSDGMGGYSNGKLASKTIVDSITRDFLQLNTKVDFKNLLKVMIDNANYRLNVIKQEQGLMESGATVAVLILIDKEAYFCTIGDSLIYLYDYQKLIQLTTEDTVVFELLKTGQITTDEAKNHPHKHILSKAMTGLQVDCEFFCRDIVANSMFIICSDGLYNMIDLDDIEKYINQNSFNTLGDKLLDSVYKNGATDNVSFILIKMEE